MKKLRIILCIILALAMTAALFACNNDTSTSGNTNNQATTSDAGNSDNAGDTSTPSGGAASDGGDEWVSITVGSTTIGRFLAGLTPIESYLGCDAVYDTVFRVDPVTKEVFSTILTDYYWEDDYTFIMKMREDVYFNNGANATAEDLIFSYLCHDERGSNYLNQFGLVFDECKPRDTYTAEMKFKAPFPDFNRGHVFYLINKEWSQEKGWDSMEWYTNPVGSGPYYAHEWQADSHLILRARDDYWNKDAGPIYVDEWVNRAYPDYSTMYMALEVGEIDICGGIQAADYSRYLRTGSDDFTVVAVPNGSVLFFCFSRIDTDLWSDKRLREALAYGVEWDKVGQLARTDLYFPAYSIASSLSPDYVKTSDLPGVYEYNPEKAKDLLAQAGYGPGNPLKLKTITMDNAMLRNAFEAFSFYANQIGVECDIEFGDTNAALSVWLTNEGNDFGFWWATAASPAGDVRATINEIADPGGVSWTSVHEEPTLMEIYSRLAYSLDDSVRSKAAKEIQQYMKDEIVYIPVSEYAAVYGFRTSVFSEEQVARYFNVARGFAFPSLLGLESAWK